MKDRLKGFKESSGWKWREREIATLIWQLGEKPYGESDQREGEKRNGGEYRLGRKRF